MLTQDAAKTVARRMTEDDFVRDVHKKIFAAVVRLVADGKPADLTLMVDEVPDVGLDYLIELNNFVPSAANIDHYIELATENARELRMAHEMRRIDEADDPRLPQLERLVQAEHDRMRPAGNKLDTARAIADYMDALVDGRKESFITTGIASFDQHNGGLPRGSVSEIAARPRVGKTAIALNMMAHMVKAGNKVALYSLEMSRPQILDRMAAQMARVPYGAIHRREASAAEVQAVCMALTDLTNDRVHIFDDIRSASAICTETARIKPDIIFIDYAQKIVPDKYHDNRHREIEQIMARLKALAVDENCHVCLLSQLSRAGKDKPQLENLKESGSLEEGGDIIFLLHRESSADGKTLGAHASLIIAKNKYGEEGEIALNFNGQYQQFEEAHNA